MNSFLNLLRRGTDRTSRLIGIYWGEVFPFYYLCEYPRSGGTWLGKMVADCLQIPYPAPPIFPYGFTCVIHNHWRYHPRLRRVIYLYRDGRDCMVSLFFHRMRRMAMGDRRMLRRFGRRYERLFGRRYDPDDTAALLPKFLEDEFAHPRSPGINWAQHIRSWYDLENRPQITYVSYEQLREDTESTLKHVVERASGNDVDSWLVQTAVEKFSMARMTGRKAGQEDRKSFIRKGVAGDWRNHFTPEAAAIFDDLAGDVLVELGYEESRNWVKAVRAEQAPPRPGFAKTSP
jgi:hypothetical protein